MNMSSHSLNILKERRIKVRCSFRCLFYIFDSKSLIFLLINAVLDMEKVDNDVIQGHRVEEFVLDICKNNFGRVSLIKNAFIIQDYIQISNMPDDVISSVIRWTTFPIAVYDHLGFPA